jgi:hypothetical protein
MRRKTKKKHEMKQTRNRSMDQRTQNRRDLTKRNVNPLGDQSAEPPNGRNEETLTTGTENEIRRGRRVRMRTEDEDDEDGEEATVNVQGDEMVKLFSWKTE